jgi:hypothetical protein
MRQLIAHGPAVERQVNELQLQNDQLAEKSEAYRRGDERIETNSAAERIAVSGAASEEVFVQQQRELETQIRELNEGHIQTRAEIRHGHENDRQNSTYVQSLIDL